ncbi:chaplin [Streptomyces sp. NPDC058301]|uniref:chaplin n=1 Tax=Streptomyces sp. NPDC058301 TaxID=3346436 RepID=UPI0036E005E9
MRAPPIRAGSGSSAFCTADGPPPGLTLTGARTALAADPGPDTTGSASTSPGVISGNTIQVPVHLPINLCGNTVDILGLLNPASGNSCASNG